jgi:hypothetical protein
MVFQGEITPELDSQREVGISWTTLGMMEEGAQARDWVLTFVVEFIYLDFSFQNTAPIIFLSLSQKLSIYKARSYCVLEIPSSSKSLQYCLLICMCKFFNRLYTVWYKM